MTEISRSSPNAIVNKDELCLCSLTREVKNIPVNKEYGWVRCEIIPNDGFFDRNNLEEIASRGYEPVHAMHHPELVCPVHTFDDGYIYVRGSLLCQKDKLFLESTKAISVVDGGTISYTIAVEGNLKTFESLEDFNKYLSSLGINGSSS